MAKKNNGKKVKGHRVYDPYREQAHSIIDSAYSAAIANYQNQKDMFTTQLQLAGKEAEKQFFDDIQKEIAKSLENDTQLTQQIQQGIDAIAKAVQNASNFESIAENSINKFKNKNTKNDQFIKFSSARDKLDNILQTSLNLNREQIIQKFCDASGLSLTTQTNKNIVWGAARSVLYTYITTGETKKQFDGYVQSLKGEYREIAVSKALEAVIQKIRPTSSFVEQIGSNADKSDSGKSPIYDIVIGLIDPGSPAPKLSEIGAQMDSVSRNFNGAENVSVVIEDFHNYFGVQSKSWKLKLKNEQIQANQYFLTVASRSDLMPKDEQAYHWHAGVLNTMSNIMSVIGLQQTLFSTGKEIFFTADLLTKFREANYVLAFNLDKVSDHPVKRKILKPEIYFKYHTD